VLAFGAIVLASALLYYAAPERTQRLRQVLPGATLATILWLIATLAFGWYVRYVVNYQLLYGGRRRGTLRCWCGCTWLR